VATGTELPPDLRSHCSWYLRRLWGLFRGNHFSVFSLAFAGCNLLARSVATNYSLSSPACWSRTIHGGNLSPEDQVLGHAEQRVQIAEKRGQLESEIKLDKPLALDDLVWHRVRYRFEYDDAKTPSVEGTESISQILRSAADREFTRQAIQMLLDARVEKEEQVWWNAEETSVYATGPSASVETTGLAVQALLQSGEASATAREALNYVASKKDAHGTWGTTQATIMALRAVLTATEKRRNRRARNGGSPAERQARREV
jgi:hypothetical protein